MSQATMPCTDGMKWVADLNLDDQNMKAPPALAAGQQFIKGWRVRNTGTCAWDATYRLVYVKGNTPDAWMGGQPVPVQGAVIPGATCDLTVTLTAPAAPGVYQGTWQMQNGQGQLFGERIWVGIQVPGPVVTAPPPPPAPPPGPLARFSADRTQIQAGERVLISWAVEGVREVYFYAQGESWQSHGVAGNAQREVHPAAATTYELRVVKLDGSVETQQIHIQVATAAAPVIAQFNVSPGELIAAGSCVLIQWDIQGATSLVRVSVNGASLWEGAPPSGSLPHCPPGPGHYAYTLEGLGPGGMARAQRDVRAVVPAAAVAAAGGPAVIRRFDASPAQLARNGCTILTWEFEGVSSQNARLTRNGEQLQADLPPAGQTMDCPSRPGRMVYRLELRPANGQGIAQEAYVDVA